MLPSYQKIKNLGHKDTAGIFDGPVIIQEKIDGSQISFGLIGGDLFVRSKGTHRDLDENSNFTRGIEAIKGRRDLLTPGAVYRGEYLRTPKHNHLAYERVPDGHIALWEVECGPEGEMLSDALQEAAGCLDFGCVPILHNGPIEDEDQIEELLESESYLGGPIEGIVIKNRGAGIYAKAVRPDFREKQKQKKPKRSDPVHEIAEIYCTEARWRKAIQHLRDDGELTGTPHDIGPLIKEIQRDIMEEHGDEIKDALFAKHRKVLYNGFIKGFPQWYQEQVKVDPFSGE